MQEIKGLVSIIIPAYNAENFINETISSIEKQTYFNLELIIVNDGSTDNTSKIIKSRSDAFVKLIEQQNCGVSAARNTGLCYAKGEFIVFFDADDIMTHDFLQIRVEELNRNSKIGFVGGEVETFPDKTKVYLAAAKNPEKEILFLDICFTTVPSNYLYRHQIIKKSKVLFNTALSSTADRFYLLQISTYTKGESIKSSAGRLLYRVSDGSMSHTITPKLLFDNEMFYKELFKAGLMPKTNTKKFKALYFSGLCKGFLKVRQIKKATEYFLKTLIINPFYLLKFKK